MNKYKINDTLYCSSQSMASPLVRHFVVAGIIKKEGEGIFYSDNLQNWVKEEYVFIDRKEVYKAMIAAADCEMNSPENMPV